jgi:hypothetical protein
MQKQDGLSVGRPSLHVRHPQAAGIGVRRRIGEVWQARESLVGCPQNRHPLMVSQRLSRWAASESALRIPLVPEAG